MVGRFQNKVVIVTGELTDESFQKSLIDKTVEKFGKLDVLVNNAGGTSPSDPTGQGFDGSMDTYDYVMNLNTKTVLLLTKNALPHLIASKGEVVMVSSIAGLPFALPEMPYYGMSKAALDQLTKSLAAKYILQGVRVNAFEASIASRLDVVPAGRVGTARDVAEAIAFLADRRISSFIVGHSLVIDGGSSLLCPLFNLNMNQNGEPSH
ncbi:unnamed protein product [Nippostrongylus brasiliensis]|uniref:NAD(P)-binding protein n=1 Tax=Nippostrongylus brasiliensis TaxID=27835 RepID=A0A0N4Y9H6_NIPBR|nr:unnamed protein product [Nippostrongylus brasiliensis]